MANPRRDPTQGGNAAALPGSVLERAVQLHVVPMENDARAKNDYPNIFTHPAPRYRSGIIVAQKVEQGGGGQSHLVETVVDNSGNLEVRQSKLDVVRRGELYPSPPNPIPVLGQAGPDANQEVLPVRGHGLPPMSFRPIRSILTFFGLKME